MDKNRFNDYLSKLVNEKFSYNPNWGSWERLSDNRIERINIGYNEYPGSYYLKGIGAYVKFNNVENIISEVLDKYHIEQRYGDETIRTVLFDLKGIDYSKFETKIHDEASFQIVAEEMKKIIEYGAIPFFEKYKTLEKVANLLSDKKAEEVVPYIQGAILFPKTILILKLTNHSKYKEKLIEFRETLKQQAAKKEIYKQMLLVYDDLFAEDLKELRYV